MNSAIKIMKLDCLLLKPYFKSIILMLLVPLLITFSTGALSEGMSFAATVIAMTTGYSFSVGEKNNLDRFYGFLPVKKSHLVIGRYLAVFSIGFISLLLSAVGQVMILSFQSFRLQFSEIVSALFLNGILFCIYVGVQFPGYYKFGSIKGKIFMFIPTVGFLIFYNLFPKLSINTMSPIFSLFQNPVVFILISLILMLFIIAISLIASIKIVNKNRI